MTVCTSLRRARGFTLVELMVVVVIITALAVLAVPAMALQLRNRWAAQAAQEVAILYRNARMQTRSRGSAVLFRFDNTNRGSVQVFEAIRGGNDANCAPLPASNCQWRDWSLAANRRLVASFDPTQNRHYGLDQAEVALDAVAPGGQAGGQFDVCFTPLGRTYWRGGYDGAFGPLSGVATINVRQKGADNQAYGLLRPVLLLPNGTARVGVAQ